MFTRYLPAEITPRSSGHSIFREISSNCRARFLRNNRNPDQANVCATSQFLFLGTCQDKSESCTRTTRSISVFQTAIISVFLCSRKFYLLTYINICEASCITWRSQRPSIEQASLRIYTGFHISWRVVWVTSNFRRFKRGFSRWKLARVSDGIKFYTYTRIQIKFHL